MDLSDGSCRIPLLHHRSVWEESRDVNTSATHCKCFKTALMVCVLSTYRGYFFKGGRVHNFGPRTSHVVHVCSSNSCQSCQMFESPIFDSRHPWQYWPVSVMPFLYAWLWCVPSVHMCICFLRLVYIYLLIGETSLFPGKSAGWEWTCPRKRWRKRERNVEAMPFEIFFLTE